MMCAHVSYLTLATPTYDQKVIDLGDTWSASQPDQKGNKSFLKYTERDCYLIKVDDNKFAGVIKKKTHGFLNLYTSLHI